MYRIFITYSFWVKTGESKPSNEKPSAVDTKDGLTNEEIRMNIEKMKSKRAAPKAQKTPSSRFVNLVCGILDLKQYGT